MGCRAGFVQVSQHYLRLLPGYDRDRSGTEIHRLLPSRSGRLAIDLRNELGRVLINSYAKVQFGYKPARRRHFPFNR